MSPRRAVTAAFLTVASEAIAQPRAPSVNTSVEVSLFRVERAPERAARAVAVAHRAAIEACVARAYATDPAPLLRLRRIEATVRLTRAGEAATVVLSPPLVARGLSACLADALLDWSQGGPVGPRASVVLRIDLGAR